MTSRTIVRVRGFLLLLAAAACTGHNGGGTGPKTAPQVSAGSDTTLPAGSVYTLSATFTDLPPGQHAFHVHAVGRCEPPFESAGIHFNPTQRHHGRDNPQGSHAGDMPNIEVTDRKAAKIEIILRDVSLMSGPNRLLDSDGASLVVHERADDYVSDPAGNAGARIACGVIAAR